MRCSQVLSTNGAEAFADSGLDVTRVDQLGNAVQQPALLDHAGCIEHRTRKHELDMQ